MPKNRYIICFIKEFLIQIEHNDRLQKVTFENTKTNEKEIIKVTPFFNVAYTKYRQVCHETQLYCDAREKNFK